MENKTVFSVSRSTKTGRPVNIGDFDTVERAQEAMLEHYRNTPKRGQFWYTIAESVLKEVGGTVFRTISVNLGGSKGPYYKMFRADELKALAG